MKSATTLAKSWAIALFFLIITKVEAQNENFGFEFGTVTTMDNLYSETPSGLDSIKWVNVNTEKNTWSVGENGILVCQGLPIGVVRSSKQYENFILHVEWRHMEPGGNSGIFAWSNANPEEGKNLPDGLEI